MANLPGTIQMSSRLRKYCMFYAGKKHVIDEHHVTHLYILYIFHSIPSLAFWHPHLQRMHAACSQPHHFPAIPVSHTVPPSASLHPWFWQTGWIDRGWINRHAACAYVLSNVPFILPTYPILFLLSACLSNASWQKINNSLNMCRSIHKVFRYCLCVFQEFRIVEEELNSKSAAAFYFRLSTCQVQPRQSCFDWRHRCWSMSKWFPGRKHHPLWSSCEWKMTIRRNQIKIKLKVDKTR